MEIWMSKNGGKKIEHGPLMNADILSKKIFPHFHFLPAVFRQTDRATIPSSESFANRDSVGGFLLGALALGAS